MKWFEMNVTMSRVNRCSMQRFLCHTGIASGGCEDCHQQMIGVQRMNECIYSDEHKREHRTCARNDSDECEPLTYTYDLGLLIINTSDCWPILNPVL